MQPHLATSTRGSSARAARPPGSAARDFYVWSDTPEQVQGRADHLQGLRDARTGPGIRSPTRTTGTASTRHQPDLNFDNPRVQRGDHRRRSTSGSSMGVDGLRLDADPVPLRARGHELREPARDARSSCKQLRAHIDAQLPGPDAARRGEPVAGGRGRLLRRRRRVPHGVPLPGHAAACSWRCAWRTASRSSTSSSRRRRSPTTASGRCSCATTTS